MRGDGTSLRRPAQVLLVLLLVLTLGWHWALLQGVAWTGMLIRYSRTVSFSQAVGFTFDGKHPCALCIAIEKGKTSEKKQSKDQVDSKSKLDSAVLSLVTVLVVHFPYPAVPAPDSAAQPRLEEPPKPPPRALPSPHGMWV